MRGNVGESPSCAPAPARLDALENTNTAATPRRTPPTPRHTTGSNKHYSPLKPRPSGDREARHDAGRTEPRTHLFTRIPPWGRGRRALCPGPVGRR